LSLRFDDFNSVGEPYTENYFRQLVVAIEATPAFLGCLRQLEDHGERGLVRETSFNLAAITDVTKTIFFKKYTGAIFKCRYKVSSTLNSKRIRHQNMRF
jgi:hypothetical protein